MTALRKRYYADFTVGDGELDTLSFWATDVAGAGRAARVFCEGRAMVFDKVDPRWDAVKIDGEVVLRHDLEQREHG